MPYYIRHLFRHDKSKLNGALKALLAISGFYMFAFGMFSPIYALFVEEIGGDLTTASNAWAIFLLTTGLLTFATGHLESRLERTEVAIMWSQAIASIGYVMYYYTDTTAILYMTQVVLGIGAAIFWPAFHSLYTSHVDQDKSTWQWSFYDGLAYIIPAISAVIGGWIVEHHGFGAIFLIMAVLSLICGIFILILPKKLL